MKMKRCLAFLMIGLLPCGCGRQPPKPSSAVSKIAAPFSAAAVSSSTVQSTPGEAGWPTKEWSESSPEQQGMSTGFGSGSPSGQSSTTAVSSVSRLTMSISAITDSSLWKGFKNGQSNVVMMSGLPGILESPRDVAATYKQVDSFLTQSSVYTKAVPKDNITHPFKESGGYMGPPALTVSDKEHKAVINPAWYIDTPDASHFVVHRVPDILEVNLDGEKLYIQSRTFYDWMYNNKWKPSFQDIEVHSQK